MGKALDRLIDLLDLEQIEVNIFRGAQPGGASASGSSAARWPARRWSRPGRTVRAGPPGALAARVLPAAGRPGGPDPLRGRPRPRRALLHHPPGRRRPARRDDLQPVRLVPPSPSRVSSTTTRCRTSRRRRRCRRLGPAGPAAGQATSPSGQRARPIDTRDVDGPMSAEATGIRRCGPRGASGCGPTATLPDDPLLHACVVTYASDMTLLDSVLLPHGLSWLDGRTDGVSLDHAMWFHRPFRADEWLLYAQDSPVGLRRPGPGPRRDLHGRTASSWSRSCRRA